MKQKKDAFTLIELLLSIITPSLRKVKEAARKAICQSNRQWGGILNMYTGDNNGRIIEDRNITKIFFVLLIMAMSPLLVGSEVLIGSQMDLVLNAPMLPYDIIYPDEWIPLMEEAFVVASPAGYSGWEDRVCIKYKTELDRYYMYTVSEARDMNILATKVDTSNRTLIPKSILSTGNRFLEGDPQLFVDGETIYMTGAIADSVEFLPLVDIYESPMYPSGKEFDFTYKTTYDPSAVDPRFDYYEVAGQIAAKEGDYYILTFMGYRVPEGQPADWDSGSGQSIQTLFYQIASQDQSGDFIWEGYPRMINVDVINVNIGVDLGTQVYQMSGPRSHQYWSDPGGGQINAMHLGGDIFEIDGQRWMYWVWFNNGNHIASARIADDFSFVDPSLGKKIWHEPVTIVQNSNPIFGEERVNENTSVFKHNGKYYFLFTHGNVIGTYGMSYIVGSDFTDIARGVGEEYKLYEPYPDLKNDNVFFTPGCREIAGSGRVITKSDGKMFMFYGIGTKDPWGNYLGRHIHYSEIQFHSGSDQIIAFKEKPNMDIGPTRIPNAIQLSWTDLGNYEYHLNALVGGSLLIDHPTNFAQFGQGYVQLHAGYLGSSTSRNITEMEFNSITYPGQVEMIPINSLTGLDGFQQSYAFDGDWGSQSARTVGYTRMDSQYIHLDASVSEGIQLSWDNLDNYQYHLNLLQDGNVIVDIPGYGSGYCFLSAGDLGYSGYFDLIGFNFNPIGTTDVVWLTMSILPGGYQYGFQLTYAYHGNWDKEFFRGLSTINWNGETALHISVEDPIQKDGLFSDDENAAHLLIGHSEGVYAYDYYNAKYNPAGGSGLPENVVDMAVDVNGVHILSDSGLTCFTYDAVNKTFCDQSVFTSFTGGNAIEMMDDGTVLVASSDGVYAWTCDGSNYTLAGGFTLSNVKDLAIDPSNTIHVLHSGGLSALSYNNGTFSPAGYWALNTDVAAIEITSGGTIYTLTHNGLNAWTYNGSVYTPHSFFAFAGGIDLATDTSGVLHVLHAGGLSQFTDLGETFVAGGFFGMADTYDIEIDSAGNIHVGKWDGISQFTYSGGAYMAEGFLWVAGGVNCCIEMQLSIATSSDFANGSPNTPVDVQLTWSSGINAVSSDVYFGTDIDAVTTAERVSGDINGDTVVDALDLSVIAGSWLLDPLPYPDLTGDRKVDLKDLARLSNGWGQISSDVFKGNQVSTSYDPGTLDYSMTYYWRIDQIAGSEIHKGEIWSFTTVAE